MSETMSLAAQVKELREAGLAHRLRLCWDGRLDEWLRTVLPAGAAERHEERLDDDFWDAQDLGEDESVQQWTDRLRAGYHFWCFPSAEVRQEYLSSVSSRSEDEVRALLRLFLFEESSFARDSETLYQALHWDYDVVMSPLPVEYRRRLHFWLGGAAKPHPSIRWVRDLLPHAPGQAIHAIAGYLNVYREIRPEGRSQGLLDAISIIRARYVDDLTAGTDALYDVSPRELERLVAALYRELGYAVQLTPPSRDGGRDVVARRMSPGRTELIEIECKAHTAAVGVEIARQLQGVVARSGASRGVLVAIGRFTRGAVAAAADDSRLELVDGATLVRLLNEVFGPMWLEDRSWICDGLD
ncbi:restriction endonuclease [Kribbella sp. NPDC058245]|uniref:restriction endonuclease n=1 Tax=Kribbella sp. NPDC058245 TaxID=3346399 RepID=UPI0036E0C205